MSHEGRAAAQRLRDESRNWFALNEEPQPGDQWLAKLHPDVERDINILLADYPPLGDENGVDIVPPCGKATAP